MKKFITLLISVFMIFSLASCSSKEDKKEEASDKKQIKIGCTTFSEITLKLAEDEIKKLGYEIEYVNFDTNILPLTAANDGSVDISFGQHEKFVKTFNQQNKGNLAMVQPYVYTTGIGLYSEKHKKLEDIPNGAQIGIMNDAMNLDRGLKIMENAGLIKLNKKENGTCTVLDIKENPKNLKFIEMEQMQTVKSLADLDASLVFFTHMFNAKKDVNAYLARDNDAKDYPMGIITKEENKNAKWAVDIANALKSESVQKKVDNHFKGVFEFYK